MSTGWMPPFETVNVPPPTSAGVSESSLARRARSVIRVLISSSESRSAPYTTGATRPSGVSTATATLISDSSSTSVSVTRAFRTGCSRSAAATSFTTIEVMPILGLAPSSFRRERNSTSGFTSSSSTEVSWAAVCRLDSIRFAIVPRRPRSGIVPATVSPPGAACCAPPRSPDRASAHATTSRSTILPPGPEPVISAASSTEKPSRTSRARARGETSPAADSRRGAEDFSEGRVGTEARAPADERAVTPAVCMTVVPPPCSMYPRNGLSPSSGSTPGVAGAATGISSPASATTAVYSSSVSATTPTCAPIGTISPASTSRCTKPAVSAVTSEVVLSVSSSNTPSPGSTWAPSGTSHTARRMSSVYAPSFGMIID